MVNLLVLLSLAAFFYVGMIYSSEAMVLLAFSATVLWAFAFFYVLFLRRSFLGKVLIPISVTDAGNPVTVQLLVKNRWVMPSARVKLLVEVTNSFEQRSYRVWLKASRLQPGENLVEYEIDLEQAGNYEVHLRKIRFYDPVGILRGTKRLDSRKNIRVLPELSDVPVMLTGRVKNFFGDSDVFDEEKAGHDNSEIFQIRPYRPGDRPQSIHWKLSAKSGELMVRESSLPKACPVVILLDYHLRRRRRRGSFAVFFEVAASLSFSLMDAGCPHYVAWFEEKSKDITRLRVDDEESFYLFFTCYLTEQGRKNPDNLKQIYDEKYRAEQYVACLRLTEQLTLLRDEEKLAQLSRSDYRAQMEKLELML